MSTKSIRRRRKEGPLQDRDWKTTRERAPSIIRQDRPTPMRVVALISLFIALLGGLAVFMGLIDRPYLISSGLGTFLLMVGTAGLLLHAFGEKLLVYRLFYGLLAAIAILAGVVFALIKARGVYGGFFLSSGAPCLGIGLLFGLSFIRNEEDEFLKTLVIRIVGGLGAVMLVVGVLGGLIAESFLLTQGVVYLLLALLYIAAYIGMQGTTNVLGYWAGFGLGVVGVVMMVVALGQSLPFANIPVVGWLLSWINDVFAFPGWSAGNPATPFVFTYFGLEFLLLSILICSDNQLIVMTRRELTAYFYSPIAYTVLIALSVLGGVTFYFFVTVLELYSPIPEPIFRTYIMFGIALFCVILMVPIITMRLFSEENRSGTMEVLLTAPVKESTVVLSKFLAALRFFLLAWYPWGLFLVALWVEGRQEFDYRPALTFAIVLAATGAGFIGFGVFFSSLTRNQIVAAILTLMAMIAMLSFHILRMIAQENNLTFWSELLRYVSFYDLWDQATQGYLAPRYLLFHISAAVFCLFLSVKVLESRKWR